MCPVFCTSLNNWVFQIYFNGLFELWSLVDSCVFVYRNSSLSDSNKTISILFDVLTHIQHLIGKLPRKLFIQTDNCPRDLKNQFVFSFYWALVDLNIFEEILVSHMPVGHTHGEGKASVVYNLLLNFPRIDYFNVAYIFIK